MNRIIKLYLMRDKAFVLGIINFISNYLVPYVPFWYFRKIIYQLLGMKIGKGSRILMGVKVVSPWKIVIGERVYINEQCYLDGRGGLKIGNDTSISIYTIILTASHKTESSTYEYYSETTTIENNVWVGARSIILTGVYLKESCVIGAGSIVSKDIYEKNTIYAGVPAKKIKDRTLKQLYQLGDWKPWFT